MFYCLPALCQAGVWTIDDGHSRLGFAATWEGSEFDGRFTRFTADVSFDPADPEAGRIDVNVDVTSADTDSAERDEAMADPDWFDFAQHPAATFMSSRIERTGDDRYTAVGELTLKGHSDTVRVPFTWREDDAGARMRGETKLDRSRFGIGEGEWSDGRVIGLDVRVIVDLALERADES